MGDADENLTRALRALRAEYLADAPARIAELWSALTRVQNGDPEGVGHLHLLVHRLAGSGGGYGLPEVTSSAQDADQACRSLMGAGTPASASDVLRLRALVQGVADAFARAQAAE
jgi:HPt (histidine-containing phosphotransfer) domain-containing protein